MDGFDEGGSMTPSQQAKSMGIKSLVQVTELTGVSKETLSNWSRDKPKLFKVVLLGCVETIKQGEG